MWLIVINNVMEMISTVQLNRRNGYNLYGDKCISTHLNAKLPFSLMCFNVRIYQSIIIIEAIE